VSTGEACVVPNIGRRQRRIRWLSGAVAATVTVGLLLVLVLGDAPRLWRLGVAIPAWFAALGFLQSREKT
jgi:hypothetical protein